jgi:hypothetical protein
MHEASSLTTELHHQVEREREIEMGDISIQIELE